MYNKVLSIVLVLERRGICINNFSCCLPVFIVAVYGVLKFPKLRNVKLIALSSHNFISCMLISACDLYFKLRLVYTYFINKFFSYISSLTHCDIHSFIYCTYRSNANTYYHYFI
jgi:hypothetical protein